MDTKASFARRLRELREVAGLTQTQLALKAGMHRQGIAKLETGVREPTWDTVQKLARALGVDCTAFQTDGAGQTEAAPAKKRKGKGG
jgi:transcriptional regulator with XRE-family HTH domain